jgi:hypothetical protein
MIHRVLYLYATAFDRELSADKLTKRLGKTGKLIEHLRSHSLDVFIKELLSIAPKRLFKQKRRRRTTIQLIQDQIPFGIGGQKCSLANSLP